jgi:hypothetical protein
MGHPAEAVPVVEARHAATRITILNLPFIGLSFSRGDKPSAQKRFAPQGGLTGVRRVLSRLAIRKRETF